MFKSLFVILFALLASAPAISYGEPYDFQKNGISYVWESEPNYDQSKKTFLNAFIKCYNQVPLEALKQPSREAMIQWLDGAFDGIYHHYKNSKSYRWFSAKANDQLVGFLIIDLAKHPEEIYLAQLAVDPLFQRRGIASTLISSLFEQFSECGRWVAITRHINEEAKGLYRSLGFVPSSYMHEGYSPQAFTGFELKGP